MLPKNAQGQNVVQASGGSGKFLAGLGAMVAGGLAMNRRRVFEDELHERRKDLATHNATLDIVKKAMGYDLEQQHATNMIPVMDAGDYRKVGTLARQAHNRYDNQKPDTNDANPTPEAPVKGAGGQTGKPDSVDDPTPKSSTSKMKPAKVAKKAASPKAKSPGSNPKPATPTKPGVKKAGPAGKAPSKNGNVAAANGNKKAGK